MSKKADSIAFNERGNTCREAGNWQAAIEFYEQAAALAPKWSSPLYNLGLVYKYQNRWAESLDCNLRATKLDSQDEAAWWNLGIAATAIGDWKTARAAWKGFGIKIPPGEGPLDFPCGFGPIRLNPDEKPEVVWANRICPARASIASIPLPESKHRWRDIVLNDGAPVGYRMHEGRELGVFNELELLEASQYGTYLVEVEMDYTDERMIELTDIAFDHHDGYAENWTQTIRMLCKACSEGRAHDEHDHENAPTEDVQRIAIATRSLPAAKELVKAWKVHVKEARFGKLEELLPPGGE